MQKRRLRTRATIVPGLRGFGLFVRMISMRARAIGTVRSSIFRASAFEFRARAFCKLLPLGVPLLLFQLVSSTAVGASVTVNASQIVTNTIAGNPTAATLSNIAVGINTSVYYNNMNASYLSPALDSTGVSIIRYPGGNYSDIYHWTSNVATGGYAATNSNFGAFAKSMLIAPNGLAKQAMISVDYGASLNNTMGGQPQEAAAWVAYSNASVNGDNATMQLGTDGEGNNWGSVRYWAGLRAANPSDANWATDGSVGVVLGVSDTPSISPGSFLKLNHAAPLGVQYWEIGNELNGNGYFGAGLNWQNDRHSLAVGAARQNDPNLSPTFYGQQVVVFAAAMKAVDPTIKIGAVLDNVTTYNPFVLAAAAPSMDFGIVHYYPNLSGTSNSTVLNFLSNRVTDVPNTITSERNSINTNAGANASHIPIFITEFGNLGSTLPAATQGLQTAIDYAAFLKSGVTSAEMWEMVTKSYLNDSASLSKNVGGSFYAMEALHDFIRPGDTFVSSSSTDNTTGIVYSAQRPDGSIALMLVNPNTTDQNMPVTINGNLYKDGGIQYATSLTADPTQSAATGLGNHFTAAVPARSIAVLILTPRLNGDFNDDGIVDAADYTVWRDTEGQTGQDLAADFTGASGTPDGVVDGLDYQFWVDHFGATSAGSGAGSFVTVPEPASIVMLAAAGIALVLFGRGTFDCVRR